MLGGRGGLEASRHLPGVRGIDAGVAVAGDQEDRRVTLALPHVVVGRVGAEPAELFGAGGWVGSGSGARVVSVDPMEILPVPYEFQRGGNRMLRLRRVS